MDRDTCPDLSLVRNAKRYAWIKTEETLGSDHRILMVTVETQKLRHAKGQAKLTDWTKFRDSDLPALDQATAYHAWAAALIESRDQHTTTIQTTEETPAIDTHLMHIWEARRSLTKRWSRQKLNRKLKLRIARLTQQAEQYSMVLARNNWIAK